MFLSGHLTALADHGSAFRRAPGVMTRKGTLRADAAETLEQLEGQGRVTVCLPASATSCQVVEVIAAIGRRVSHTDMAAAIEAAMARAGGDQRAVICAEPSRVQLDGVEPEGSPIGRPAQTLTVNVTVFVSPLPFLSSLEKACDQAGLELGGVLAMEEAVAASLTMQADETRSPLLVFDRWRTKLLTFHGEQIALSATGDLGPGHLADDLAVTFDVDHPKAEELVRRVLLGRAHHEEAAMIPVVEARLAEIATHLATIAKAADQDMKGARLVGLAPTPMVLSAFAAEGLEVRGADKVVPRTDPAILAMAEGARRLASGAVPRSVAAAMHLENERAAKGPFDWLRRNF